MSKAFTLVEILLVLAIIGIGLVSVTPILTERTVRGDEVVAFFEELLEEHRKFAVEDGVPVKIIGFKGGANILKHDGHRTSIPGIRSIQTVEINDERTPGIEYHITVYPDGLCDHFILETDRRQLIESYPILMTVTRKAKNED